MNLEILLITEQLKQTYEGEPWFGRSIKEILSEIDERIVFERPNSQHSILELLWHMITWREFTVNRLQSNPEIAIDYFEKNDWRELDHSNKSLWQQGLQRIAEVQKELIETIQQQKDELLSERVQDRKYDFRKLLYGITEHDIYHLGQIAYVKKMLQQ